MRGHPRRHADATCQRVCDRATQPTPLKNVQAINADSSSATATTERNRSARGTTSMGGGARGRPRRNADATCRRVGHQAMQLSPPIDARAINAVSSSATARPNAIVAPGGRRAREIVVKLLTRVCHTHCMSSASAFTHTWQSQSFRMMMMQRRDRY